MSTKQSIISNKEFIKQVIRGVVGAVILIILLVLWLTWDGIYDWFYTSVAPNAMEGTLLIFWLLVLFPLIGLGSALTLAGGWRAYRIAVPPKEEKS